MEIAWIIALESLPGGELFSSSSLSSSFYEIPVISSSRISWLDLAGRRIPVTPFSRARKASRGFMVYEPPSISMPRLRFRFGPSFSVESRQFSPTYPPMKRAGRMKLYEIRERRPERCTRDIWMRNPWLKIVAREEKEEKKEAENISRIFGRRNPSWVWGRKGLEILEANDIAAWISIESAQLRCSPVT